MCFLRFCLSIWTIYVDLLYPQKVSDKRAKKVSELPNTSHEHSLKLPKNIPKPSQLLNNLLRTSKNMFWRGRAAAYRLHDLDVRSHSQSYSQPHIPPTFCVARTLPSPPPHDSWTVIIDFDLSDQRVFQDAWDMFDDMRGACNKFTNK